MDKLNILFVCSKNKWRSPTAETIYRKDTRFNVRSAGTSATAKKRISEKDIRWASLILVMENKHKKRIVGQYNCLDLPPIEVLDIPDEYQYMDEELIAIVKLHTEEYIVQNRA